LITPSKGVRTSPPADTVALAVNVGAIRIFETSSKKYVDGVGTEEAGKLIMIPWNNAWYYSAAGSLPLGTSPKQKQNKRQQITASVVAAMPVDRSILSHSQPRLAM
jgi:hypothetical protein